MTPDPITFARGCGTRGPCAQFVAQWLFLRGVAGTPSLRAILRDWRAMGVEAGAEHWCRRLGLAPSAPCPGAVALARQPGGGPLLGLIDGNGLFVTRSFSRVLIDRRPDIIKAWRV
jgi:hypothetical protein